MKVACIDWLRIRDEKGEYAARNQLRWATRDRIRCQNNNSCMQASRLNVVAELRQLGFVRDALHIMKAFLREVER